MAGNIFLYICLWADTKSIVQAFVANYVWCAEHIRRISWFNVFLFIHWIFLKLETLVCKRSNAFSLQIVDFALLLFIAFLLDFHAWSPPCWKLKKSSDNFCFNFSTLFKLKYFERFPLWLDHRFRRDWSSRYFQLAMTFVILIQKFSCCSAEPQHARLVWLQLNAV